MTFNSFAFAAFLPTVIGLHWLLPHRWRLHLIVAASYVFYGSWDYRFLALLWLSTGVDFAVARAIERSGDERQRRRLLLVSVAVNLGLLGTFKYVGFFVESATAMAERIGLSLDPVTLNILLPVGISFYTFQTLGYTIDVYRGRTPACRSLLLFAAYVAYFPQLVAGPIERSRRLIPQLAAERRRPSAAKIESALLLIVLGLFKKVVIADQVAPAVNEVFSSPGAYGRVAIVAAALGFAVQIYADFAGYTDIARGVSRLVGIELVENFHEPFLAPNITDLWRRWHISLTTWLRDYVYIPLGGSTGGPSRANLALLLTWLATGLWHGAGLTFIFFGLLNGAYLVAHRALQHRRPTPSDPRLVRQIGGAVGATLLFALSALFFRAESFEDSLELIHGLVVGGGRPAPAWVLGAVFTSLVATIVHDLLRLTVRRRQRLPVPRASVRGALVGALGVLILLASGSPAPQFIYFQF